jgi:hypothetical protein
MRPHAELTTFLFEKALIEHPGLTEEAAEELHARVQVAPLEFATTTRDVAACEITQALEVYYAAQARLAALDDDEYFEAREAQLATLIEAATYALSIDPACITARLVEILAREMEPAATFRELAQLDHGIMQAEGPLVLASPTHMRPLTASALVAEATGAGMEGARALNISPALGPAVWGHDALYEHYESRARLRVQAALSRAAIDAGHYAFARDLCTHLLELDPLDRLGAHYTQVLCYARLEDEAAFTQYDRAHAGRGDAWSNLARVLLLYKIDRLPAATRALKTMCRMNTGAAYALLRPRYVELYLPDRPIYRPGSFDEMTLAVREVDPIVVDTPDFIRWAASHEWLVDEAAAFAHAEGLDW